MPLKIFLKFIRYVILIIVILPLLLFIYWWIYEHKQATAMETLQTGDALSKIINVAGRPSFETDGTWSIEPRIKKPFPGCVKELWYRAWLSPFPSAWSYCVSADGILLQKTHWVSW